MFKPVMPDIVEKLKKMVFEYIAECKSRVDTGWVNFYFEDSQKINDPKFWDHFLYMIFYKAKNPDLQRLRNIVTLQRIHSLNPQELCFIAFEINEEVSIQITLDLDIDGKYVSYNKSPYYFTDVMQKVISDIKYKDSGYYLNKPSQTLLTAGIVFRLKSSNNRFGRMYIDNNKITPEFIQSLTEFIYDDSNVVLTINSIGNLTNYQIGKGLRLYKIPEFNYDWRPYIEKVKNKALQLDPGRTFYDDDMLRYCSYTISFEYSPDDYLEIYATKQALINFWLEEIDEIDPCGGIFKYDRFDDRMIFHMINYIAPLNAIDIPLYEHRYGSVNNCLLRELFVYEIEKYRDYYCEE